MGWEDREYATDEPGGFGAKVRRVLRRVFGEGENPFDWALPLYTAWGIRVRIHLVFVIMIIADLLWSLPHDGLGWRYKALGLVSLFVLVLLHEYGHCIACRLVGGTANQILMWPLGGLASCAPPHNWRANFITTAGGPGVNLVLIPVFGAALLALGQGKGAVIFNPFNPAHVIGGLRLSDGTMPFWLVTTWWLYYTNLLLFTFNMLLPMYPMDAGRLVHAVMWRSLGYRRATEIAVQMGLVVAVILFVFGIVGDNSRLTAIAVFGGLVCWFERRRLRTVEGTDPTLDRYDFERGYGGFPDDDDAPRDSRKERRLERERRKAEEEQAELDRILAKIARSGMSSLTKSEKRWLQRATEQRRSG